MSLAEPDAPVNWPGRPSLEARFDSVPWYCPRPVTELIVRPHLVVYGTPEPPLSYLAVLAPLNMFSQMQLPRPSILSSAKRRRVSVYSPVRVCSRAVADGAVMPEQVASVNWPERFSLEAGFDSELTCFSRPVTEL